MSASPLTPRDHAEEVAVFRSQVIGPLAQGSFDHGELATQLRLLSKQRFRPPDAAVTRAFSVPTLERWYYAWKSGGLAALIPRPRSDRGRAKALDSTLRDLLCDIRREHPTASAALILSTLQAEGRLAKGALSESTLRRLFQERGLDRQARSEEATHTRQRWEAAHPGALFHGDVCHGPNLLIEGRSTPLRIHGMLDDASRFVIALEARPQELEHDMLVLLTNALRRLQGRPDALYLDNGSTYSGEALATFCARLDLSLLHAKPYDPQARGKMERFWRTLREGLLDHLDPTLNLAQVQQRLDTFLDKHYHSRPHSSLFGKTPREVWERRQLHSVNEAELGAALIVRERRRVSRDGVVSLDGHHFELRQSFLANRIVVVVRSLLQHFVRPVVEYDGRRFELFDLDVRRNGSTPREPPPPREPSTPPPPAQRSLPFDPHQPR
jgi:transposase InsO family protein